MRHVATQGLSIILSSARAFENNWYIPYPSLPDIACSPLIQEVGDLGQLRSPGARIVEQVAELRRIGADLIIVLLELGVTFEHQDLVFWAASLACGVH